MLALFVGVVYLFLFTPGTEPDSMGHFATVYYDANLLLRRTPIDANGNVKIRVEDLNNDGLTIHAGLANINIVKQQLFAKATENKIVSLWRGRLNVPIIAHLPQAIGVSIGILSGMGATTTLYLGKIFGLLFYILCVYIAIKITPIGKKIIFFVALLPYSIETATSLSYDCVVLGLALLMIGYSLYLGYKKDKVKWKDIFIWYLMVCWIGPCKVIYVLIGGLILIVPKRKFNTSKTYYIGIFGTIVVGIVSVLVTRMSFVSSIITGTTEEYYTLDMFLQNIPHGLYLIGNAIHSYTGQYLLQMFGSMYSWMDINLPFWFTSIYIVLMFFMSFEDNGMGVMVNKKDVIILGGIIVLVCGGIVAGLMFGWTPKDAVAVEGIQGRYFLPILPLGMLLVGNKLPIYVKNVEKWLMLIMIFVQYLTTLELYACITLR